MERVLRVALFSCFLFSLCISSFAQNQTCKSYSFSENRQFVQCQDLPALSCFLHWNYDQIAGTVSIAFRHTAASSSKWTAWAINPNGQRMAGSQALVAFVNSSGSAYAYTSSIDSESPSMQSSTLKFTVSNLSATFINNNEMTIFATLHLSQDLLSTNQVWQEGPMSGVNPSIHNIGGENLKSMATINFVSGEVGGTGSADSRLRKRNTHGVLNAISWGTLMPLGAMMARYLKVFKAADPAWFYLHVATQSSAYIVGVAGFATGIKLGSESSGDTKSLHRNIGIVLFIFGALQGFALLLRPKKDHKYRLYWNIYHHSIGYSTIILSIINVFEGLHLLNPAEKWKKIYIGILIFLGFNAAMLEAFTWYIVIKRKRAAAHDKHSHGVNGTNGVNGYGARTHPNV
ncbi:hypothetical protein SLA2020_200210 [Shorea laevis]